MPSLPGLHLCTCWRLGFLFVRCFLEAFPVWVYTWTKVNEAHLQVLRTLYTPYNYRCLCIVYFYRIFFEGYAWQLAKSARVWQYQRKALPGPTTTLVQTFVSWNKPLSLINKNPRSHPATRSDLLCSWSRWNLVSIDVFLSWLHVCFL